MHHLDLFIPPLIYNTLNKDQICTSVFQNPGLENIKKIYFGIFVLTLWVFQYEFTENILEYVGGHHANQTLVPADIASNNFTTMGKNILQTSFNGCMNCGCDRANTFTVALVILTLLTSRETEPRNIAHLEQEGGHHPHHPQLT